MKQKGNIVRYVEEIKLGLTQESLDFQKVLGLEMASIVVLALVVIGMISKNSIRKYLKSKIVRE